MSQEAVSPRVERAGSGNSQVQVGLCDDQKTSQPPRPPRLESLGHGSRVRLRSTACCSNVWLRVRTQRAQLAAQELAGRVSGEFGGEKDLTRRLEPGGAGKAKFAEFFR
jgi:hypothetical protein